MVLEALGIVRSEDELRALCDCTPLLGGTDAWRLVDAARYLGFSDSSKQNLVFDPINDLKLLLEQGVYPIAYLRTRLLPESQLEQHAVVIVELAKGGVQVLDPMRGECVFPTDEFLREWERMRYLVILVR